MVLSGRGADAGGEIVIWGRCWTLHGRRFVALRPWLLALWAEAPSIFSYQMAIAIAIAVAVAVIAAVSPFSWPLSSGGVSSRFGISVDDDFFALGCGYYVAPV